MPLRAARTGESMNAVVGNPVDLTATLNPEYGAVSPPVALPATEPATSQVISLRRIFVGEGGGNR